MWREPSRLILVVVLALFVASCTNGSAEPTTSTRAATTTTRAPTTTTTAPPTTTTPEPTETTTGFIEPVGSPDALVELLDEVRGFLSVLYSEEVAASLPVPDLTNPDPAEAARELLLFETSVIQIATVREYADVMAVASSPAYGALRRDLDAFENNKLRMQVNGNYEVHSVGTISAEDGVAASGQNVLDLAPAGSVFVTYETSLSPYEIVQHDGTVVQREDGWERRQRVALVSPTDSGWKYFWVES